MNIHSKITRFFLAFSFFTCLQPAEVSTSPHAAACKIQSATRMWLAICHLAQTHPHLDELISERAKAYPHLAGLLSERARIHPQCAEEVSGEEISGYDRLTEIRDEIRVRRAVACNRTASSAGSGTDSDAEKVAEIERQLARLERRIFTPRTASTQEHNDHTGAAVAGAAAGTDGLLSDAASLAVSAISSNKSAIFDAVQDNSEDIIEFAKEVFEFVSDACRGCQRMVNHCEAMPCKDEVKECCENANPCWPLCELCADCFDCCSEAGGCTIGLTFAGLCCLGCCCYKGTKKTYKCCKNKACPWCYQKCCESKHEELYGSPKKGSVVPAQVAMGAEGKEQAWQEEISGRGVLSPSGVAPGMTPGGDEPLAPGAHGVPKQ